MKCSCYMFTVMYTAEAAQSRRIESGSRLVCVDITHTGDGTGLDFLD